MRAALVTVVLLVVANIAAFGWLRAGMDRSESDGSAGVAVEAHRVRVIAPPAGEANVPAETSVRAETPGQAEAGRTDCPEGGETGASESAGSERSGGAERSGGSERGAAAERGAGAPGSPGSSGAPNASTISGPAGAGQPCRPSVAR